METEELKYMCQIVEFYYCRPYLLLGGLPKSQDMQAWRGVFSGILKGSALTPMLFNIFIKDIQK